MAVQVEFCLTSCYCIVDINCIGFIICSYLNKFINEIKTWGMLLSKSTYRLIWNLSVLPCLSEKLLALRQQTLCCNLNVDSLNITFKKYSFTNSILCIWVILVKSCTYCHTMMTTNNISLLFHDMITFIFYIKYRLIFRDILKYWTSLVTFA